MAKQINCSVCATEGETIAMKLENSFFKCPVCGAELHINDSGDNTFIRSWLDNSNIGHVHCQRGFMFMVAGIVLESRRRRL